MSGSAPAEPSGPAVTAAATPSWADSAGLAAGAIAALVLVSAGLLLSQIDLALLAMPLLVSLVWARDRRPDPTEAARAHITLATPEGEQIAYRLGIDAPPGVEGIVLRCTLLAGQEHELVVAGPSSGEVTGQVPVLHSGPQELVRLDYRLLGADAAAVSFPPDPLIAGRVLSPPHAPIHRLPLPHRLQGLIGTHESARIGDGGDLRDIHQFTAGDRLRRIDWKATARRGRTAADLYVRRTAALADTTVLIVMHSRDDVGEQVAQWSRNIAAEKGLSALDVAREAAGSIAAGYIRAGDRVGFQDLSSRRGMVPHGGGARHLWRLLRAIEMTEPAAVAFRRRRPPIVPPGALVYLLSSFLDDEGVQLALRWRGAGHRVIAVDVLPAPQFAQTNRYDRIAHRIVLMAQRDRIRTLQAGGVELLRWPQDDARVPRLARIEQLTRPPRSGSRAGGRR